MHNKTDCMKNLKLLLLLIPFVILTACNQSRQKPEAQTGNVPEITAAGKVAKLSAGDFRELVWDFEKKPNEWIYKGNKPCVIDFYADWCAPCKTAAPILDELAEKYKGRVYFYKIDTDKEQELAGIFGIRTIPTFLYVPMEGEPRLVSGIGPGVDATRKIFIDNIEQNVLGNLPEN